VRNHVVDVLAGDIDFDCLTEFWVADRGDQARTAAFVGTPEFAVLDEDDGRFLDVTRRLSFEVEECEWGATDSRRPSPIVTRVSMFLQRPSETPCEAFSAELRGLASGFAADQAGRHSGVALDLRPETEPGEGGPDAILSIRLGADREASDPTWPKTRFAARIALLECVETPPELLYMPTQDVQDGGPQ
jgi:hypothetical protein